MLVLPFGWPGGGGRKTWESGRPDSTSTSSAVVAADPPTQTPYPWVRHTRVGRRLPHWPVYTCTRRPPTPGAATFPDTWTVHQTLHCEGLTAAGPWAFSPDSPHLLLSGCALNSFLLATLRVAPRETRAPGSVFYTSGGRHACVTKPRPLAEGSRGPRKEAGPRRPQPMGNRKGQKPELGRPLWWASPFPAEYKGAWETDVSKPPGVSPGDSLSALNLSV